VHTSRLTDSTAHNPLELLRTPGKRIAIPGADADPEDVPLDLDDPALRSKRLAIGGAPLAPGARFLSVARVVSVGELLCPTHHLVNLRRSALHAQRNCEAEP
jgi:hypothetical protein